MFMIWIRTYGPYVYYWYTLRYYNCNFYLNLIELHTLCNIFALLWVPRSLLTTIVRFLDLVHPPTFIWWRVVGYSFILKPNALSWITISKCFPYHKLFVVSSIEINHIAHGLSRRVKRISPKFLTMLSKCAQFSKQPRFHIFKYIRFIIGWIKLMHFIYFQNRKIRASRLYNLIIYANVKWKKVDTKRFLRTAIKIILWPSGTK